MAATVAIDEQIVYDQLDDDADAIWSLLLASGYLKVNSFEQLDEIDENEDQIYELTLTNQEVRRMFRGIVQGWFKRAKAGYSGFIMVLLLRGRRC